LARADEVGVISLQHVPKIARHLVDAPEFVRAWNELSFFVPAFNPCDAIVEAEETGRVPSAAFVLDSAVLFAHLVIRSEKVAFEYLGVFYLDRWCHLDRLWCFPLGCLGSRSVLLPMIWAILLLGVPSLLVRGDKVPTTPRDVFINTRDRAIPMLLFAFWSLAFTGLEPFVRREECLSGNK
jgi:hypothetical protein